MWMFVSATVLSRYWTVGSSMPIAPGLRTMISTDARRVPDARSWNNCALYLSSGFVNWNPWKLTLPAPAPLVVLPIESEFWASSVNDDRSNALVAPVFVWVVSPTGVGLSWPRLPVGVSTIVMSAL